MTLGVLLIFLVGLGYISYQSLGARYGFIWSMLMVVAFILFGHSIILILLAFIIGSVLLLFSLPEHRKRFITKPVFKVMSRAVPTMSQTEREALEAGTVWWDGEIFSGNPDWEKLRAIPPPSLSVEEQAFLDGPVETLCSMINDWQATQYDHDLSPEVWAFIKKEKFFGMIIPKEYGGLEFSAMAHSAVVAKISTRSISAAVTVMVPNSLGPGELLLHYGTDEQKDHYLPKLATGEEIPCFALTGPEAGSDAAALPDKGVVCMQKNAEGDQELGIKVTWNKRYITLAPVATVLGIAFKLTDPDALLGDTKELGITCALIPTNTEGVKIGERHSPLNAIFMNGPTQGEDVFIPMSWVIGGQAYVGKGWRMLMESLATGRCISLPALSVGGAQLAAKSTGAYARIRRQFNTSIGNFEGVQEVLARIGGYAYQMNATRTFTLGALDTGERPSVVSAILKYHLTERLRITVNDAMDIQGGSGICMGERNLFARAYQTIPVAITVEGANILTRSLIIFGQGAMRAHPTLLKELEALRDDDADAFDSVFCEHIATVVRNKMRSFWLGITFGKFEKGVASKVSHHYVDLSQLSASFAFLADVTLALLGGGLKRKERVSARLGDALSNVYLASATLKQFHDDCEPDAARPFVDWAMARAKYDAQRAMSDVLRNYPNKLLGAAMRLVIFPLGRRHHIPSDKQDYAVAKCLLEPSDAREQLTHDVFVDPSGQTGKLENALRLCIEAEPIEKKIKQKMGRKAMVLSEMKLLIKDALEEKVIDQSEVKILLEAAIARNDVIQVDSFNPDLSMKEAR